MHLINVENAPQALQAGLRLLLEGPMVHADSRAGKVLLSEDPVTTRYSRPQECVVFHPARDANPFFHLMCAVWMISGDRRVDFVEKFNSNYRNFAEDDGRMHGAYGFRWRAHWEIDQLQLIAEELKANPNCRRQLLCMWDPEIDCAVNEPRDIPCNVAVHFQRPPSGRLNMTVFCRSNDALWGCYGEDVVTFSILQQYVAARIGCEVGNYWQVSDNWHAYDDSLKRIDASAIIDSPRDPYATNCVSPMLLKGNMETFDMDVKELVNNGTSSMGRKHPFVRKILTPMYEAYGLFKTKHSNRHDLALERLQDMPEGNDWRLACEEWITRRKNKTKRRSTV